MKKKVARVKKKVEVHDPIMDSLSGDGKAVGWSALTVLLSAHLVYRCIFEVTG